MTFPTRQQRKSTTCTIAFSMLTLAIWGSSFSAIARSNTTLDEKPHRTNDKNLEEVQVFGHANELIGQAEAASQGSVGDYALTADNSQRSKSLTTVNLRGVYHWKQITLYAQVINLLDTDRKEIAYYYPAYVQGLDPAGLSADDIDCSSVDCTVSRATEPRTLRAGVTYKF